MGWGRNNGTDLNNEVGTTESSVGTDEGGGGVGVGRVLRAKQECVWCGRTVEARLVLRTHT